MRILAVADEVSEALYGPTLKEIDPYLIVSCGDLPFEYLEYLVTVANVPLLYVLGNHDPPLRKQQDPREVWRPGYVTEAHRPAPGPQGCIDVDGLVVDVADIRVLGLGGSKRYKEGPHQYTDVQMRRRVRRMVARVRLDRLRGRPGIDIVVTHSPPLGLGDRADGVHEGFSAFRNLIDSLQPHVFVHGHVHPYGDTRVDLRRGETLVVNAVGYRVLELEAEDGLG